MPIALLAAAVVGMSLPALLIRWARMPNEVLSFWRLALAAAALAPWAWSRRTVWKTADPRPVALAGALFFVHLWTFVHAVEHTTIANTMTIFCTHPLWTALGARLFFGQPLRRREGLAFALAMTGVLVLFGGKLHLGAGMEGDAAALLSAMFYSSYLLCGRQARRRLDNASFVAPAYGLAALLFLALGAARGVAWTGHAWPSWAAVAGLAFAVTLGGHALFAYLLEWIDVGVLGRAKLIEPVLSALGAAAFFGEPLTGRAGAAFALIAAGVIIDLKGLPKA